MNESGEPIEAEVDAVIAEFGGDPRAAVRALLHDLAALARDQALTVSRGYVRGRLPTAAAARGLRGPDAALGRKGGS